MNRMIGLAFALTLVVGLGSSSASAQTPPSSPPSPALSLPPAYTISVPPAPHDDLSMKIYRDGPRELVVLSRPSSKARAGGWTSHVWYDFQAHRQYADDSNAPKKCGVIVYTSATAPELQDPVVMSAGMSATLPKELKPVGTERLAGIDTTILEATQDGNTMRVWKDLQHSLVIKMVMTPKGHPAQTVLNLTGLTFAKPDPALLIPPQRCQQLAGESTAQGGHAVLPAGSH